MKEFNINDYMYIQITEDGWEHLKKTVGIEYINACIDKPSYRKIINGETWYRLQCWNCFDLMPLNVGGKILFMPAVMFDDESLNDIDTNFHVHL
jgi:hypothetical protein